MRYWLYAGLIAGGMSITSGQTPAPAGAATKSTATSKKTYTAPKTPWGDPDLQGIWPSNMGTPMQRPDTVKGRAEFNDAEYAERVQRAQTAAQADLQEFASEGARVGIGPPSYWTERGKPTRQTSLIIDPPEGKLPPLTAEEQEIRKNVRGTRGNAEAAEMNIYVRCVTRGLLGSIIPVVYNNGNQIVQAPGYVVIRNEMIHEARVIPLDGRAHVGQNIREYMGDSRGHWEGNTLVIETTNLTDKDFIGSNGAGYAGDPGHHSEDLKVIERITRVGPDQLEYKATVIDPKVWTKPWTMLIQLRSDGKYQYFEYACHEGNYAMKAMLEGARVQEAAAPK
jgi:hypothetical protein